MAKQKKFILQESEIPTQWYNIQADMPNKPMPPIHPATKQPLGVDDLAHIFPRECCVQELDTEHRWIDIPEDVLEKYKYYRPKRVPVSGVQPSLTPLRSTASTVLSIK